MSTTRRSLILSFAAIAAVAQPTDTAGPGALQFREWLRHFNLGDENAYREYLEKHFPQHLEHIRHDAGMRAETGGFELHRFEEATGEKVVVLLREREGERFARAEMKFESPDAVRIARLRIQPTARPDDVPAPARLSEPDAVAALKAKAAELAARDRFSGAVLLGKDGKVLYREAFGLADRESGVKNEVDTKFRIGSMNKMFTAVAVAQLAQAGKLRFEDTLSQHLPDYPNRDAAGKVTIHHLLTHTGGTGISSGRISRRTGRI